MAKFRINLANPKTIQNSIDRLQKMVDSKREFENAMLKQVAERLLGTIKLNMSKYDNLYDSDAIESLHLVPFMTETGATGWQIVGADYILYIEYGTGIYEEGGTGRDTPWVYFDKKRDHWYTTLGMQPRPFIRQSIEEVRATMHEDVQVAISGWAREWQR